MQFQRWYMIPRTHGRQLQVILMYFGEIRAGSASSASSPIPRNRNAAMPYKKTACFVFPAKTTTDEQAAFEFPAMAQRSLLESIPQVKLPLTNKTGSIYRHWY